MKLLLITQKIDKEDSVLGVYHDWAREIAKSFDKLSVICLYEGRNELLSDIKVMSLGKEEKNFQFSIFNFQTIFNFKIFNRCKYLWRFYRYIRRVRSDYDAVLVHMNPVYVILGWPVWKVMGKKVYLWYAHPGWNLQVKLACILCDRVLTSVPEAFHKKGGKVVAIGQGIDTERFSARGRSALGGKNKNSILFLGRISPSKNIHILIEALGKLNQEGVQFKFCLVGSPPDAPGAVEYDKKIRGMSAKLLKSSFNNLADRWEVHGSVPYAETVEWYNKSEVFVNLSPTGHFDKTVLEAMASGCIALASNDAYYNVFPKDLHEYLIFKQEDAQDLAKKLKKVLELTDAEKDEIGRRLREIVVENHSIYTLGHRIAKIINHKS